MIIYHQKNINKNIIKNINYNETENYFSSEEDTKNNKINFKKSEIEDEEKEDNKGITIDHIFNLIIGYGFDRIIEPEYIQRFF